MKADEKPPAYVLPAPRSLNLAGDSGWCTLKCRFNKPMNDWLFTQPGAHWDRQRAFWLLPKELVSEAVRRLQDAGFTVDYRDGGRFRDLYSGETPRWNDLRQYQREHAMLAANQQRWIEGSEMGTGKTPIALMAAQMRGVKRGIVIDSRAHCLDWFNPKRPEAGEFGRWWPGHPDIEVIENWERAAQSDASIRIVSWHLLPKLNLTKPIDFVFMDEVHYLQNPDTYWSIAARKLINDLHPHAWVLAMTGTLIPDDTMTMFNILDTLWPKRFGWSKWDFAKAYSVGEMNDFGKMEFCGINQARARELQERLTWVSARKTKLEILRENPNALPPFTPRISWFEEGRRQEHALELAHELLGQHPKITVLTHLRETAQRLAEELKDAGVPVVSLVGDGDTTLPARQRHELIFKAKQMQRCAIVSTLHSVKEGISLTFAPKVIYAECYQRPVEVLQSLNRFNRMDGSTDSADLFLLAQRGGDPVMETLHNKIEAAASVWRPGTSETGMLSVTEQLKNKGLTQEDINALLQGAATEFVADEFS